MNHKREIERLPDEVKKRGNYICIGDLMAKIQFGVFIEMVRNGKVKVSNKVIRRMIEKGLIDHDPSKTVTPQEPPESLSI